MEKTASSPKIKAVLFDYGMVISGPPDPAAWAQMRSVTGLEEEPLHQGYWAHRHAYDRGDLNAHSYWHRVGTDAGLVLTPAQIKDLIAIDVDLWGQLNLPMLEWAQALQQAGVVTGILSNIGDGMAEGLCARYDWLSQFDHCTWSHSLNIAKPEPSIYKYASEGLNTAPGDILFIDDRIENIRAAEAVGMRAIQYRDHDSFEREMRSRGWGDLLELRLLSD